MDVYDFKQTQQSRLGSMNDFKLKVVLMVLTGIIFSFIFIILAFVLPTKTEEQTIIKKPSNLLEEVSKSLQK